MAQENIFDPPIYLYRSRFVEVTAQNIWKIRIFGDFLHPRNMMFLEGSKIQKRKTSSEGPKIGKISISVFFTKIGLWTLLNNMLP